MASVSLSSTADEVLAVENIFKNVGVGFIILLWCSAIIP